MKNKLSVASQIFIRRVGLVAICAAILINWLAIVQSSTPARNLPGDLATAAAAGNQLRPDIARGSNGYLSVWADNRSTILNSPGYVGIGPRSFHNLESPGLGTQSDIYAARLDAAGNVVDTIPIVISKAQFNQDFPLVAWNGENYLVTWTTERNFNFSIFYDILAVRVSPAGVVLDDPPILISEGQDSNFRWPSTITSDGTNWAIAWSSFLPNTGGERPLFGARVSPAGVVLDPGGKIIFNAGHQYIGYPDLAFAVDEYLIVYEELDAPRALRLSQSLDPIGSPFTLKQDSPTNGVKVATDGTNFLAVWSDDAFSYDRIFGTRVSHTGVVLDPGGLLVGDRIFNNPLNFDATFDGTNYFVAYNKSDPIFSGDDIFVGRVSPSGTVLDPAGLLVKGGPTRSAQPTLAPQSGGGVQVIWTEDPTGNPEFQDIFTASVSAGGTANPDHAVSLGAPRQSKPRMTAGGQGFMVVFRSEVSGDARIFAQRLNTDGDPLDPEPILLASGSPWLTTPSVAWNGVVFLVTWEDSSANNSRGQVFGRRVSPEGTVLDAQPISIMPGQMSDVAALGETFLVVDTDAPTNPQIRSVFWVRVSSAGVVLDAPSAPSTSGFQRWPRVAAFAGRWLIVKEGHATHDRQTSSVSGIFVNPDGSRGPAIQISGGVNNNYGQQPHLAVAGNQALVVWADKANTDIFGRRVLADGTMLDSLEGFVISNAPEHQFFPAVAWDGSEYLVNWIDHRNDPFPLQPRGDIYGARVNTNATVLDPDGLAIANSPLPEDTPAVAAANGMGMFAYAAFLDRQPYANFRIQLRRFPFDANYAISANPSSRAITPGSSTTYTVNLTPIGGFSGTVTFSVQGLPSGASAGFNPASLTGSGTSTLTVTTNSRTPEGNFPLTVVGTNGSQQSTAQILLTISNNPTGARYGVTDLGSLGGSTFEARSVNDSGQVAGSSSLTTTSTITHAFRYSGGTMQDLGALGGPQSEAHAINNSGQVVGIAKSGAPFTPRRAFLHNGTAMQDIGSLPGGVESYAFGMNDAGLIVGASQFDGQSGPIACIYNNGTVTGLGTFGGLISYAMDVNNSGLVVGHASITNGSLHAFIYNGGTKQDLGTLGGSDSYAWGVNDAGVVVGGSAYRTDFIWPHAYRYSNGVMQDLGTLGGSQSEARAINNAGQIVGFAQIDNGQNRAFLYEGGQMINLNNLIPADAGWVLTHAYGISENGYITGKGTINGQPKMFLLSPTAPGCTYSISPGIQSFTTSGGNGVVHVTAASGCNWAAASNVNWVTITTGASGTGNGVVTYSVTASNTARTGTVTIAGQTFTVTQAGTGCAYTVSPTSESFAHTGGAGTVNVTATSACSWTAVSHVNWITVTAGASSTGSGVVSYTVAANSNVNPRSGTITIADRLVTVSQAGNPVPCTYTLSATSGSIPSGGGVGEVSITTPDGCAWTASSNASWVSINFGSTSGTGSRVVSFFASPNSSPTPRSGTLTIAGQTYTVNQAEYIDCSYTFAPASRSFTAAGGTGSFAVTIDSRCNWTATTHYEWLSVTSGGGAGSGAVTFTVAPNPSNSPRSGYIFINGGYGFTIYQATANWPCALTPISSGQMVTGAITSGDCRSAVRGGGSPSLFHADDYSFTGTAGQQVSLWLNSVTFDNYLYLLGPGQNVIALDGGFNNSRIPYNGGTFTLPEDGTYIIEVTTSSFNENGAYTLGFNVPVVCSYILSQSSRMFLAEGGSYSFGVAAPAGCNWTATSNASWISIYSGASGTGNGGVYFSVQENTGSASRTGTLTIGGQTFTVVQAGVGCSYSISATSAAFNEQGGTGSVEVTSGSNCSWSVSSLAPWVSVTTGATGTGNGAVTFTVEPNTGIFSRAGVILIAGQSFTLYQAEAGNSCQSWLSSNSQSFTANGGASSVNTTAPAGCNWTATSNANWITINTTNRTSSSTGNVPFNIAPNTTGGVRSGTITIADETFVVYQGVEFADVPASHPFYTQISKLAARGITLGCSGGNYCPDAPVTREQMAAFILKALGEFNPPVPAQQRFTDVGSANPFYGFIELLAQRGITAGCGGANYCPTDPVTREQMAVFLIKALGMPNPPSPPTQRFADVPSSRMGYAFIDQMAQRGITAGCGGANYCPDAFVTRAQMAAFLVKAFDL